MSECQRSRRRTGKTPCLFFCNQSGRKKSLRSDSSASHKCFDFKCSCFLHNEVSVVVELEQPGGALGQKKTNYRCAHGHSSMISVFLARGLFCLSVFAIISIMKRKSKASCVRIPNRNFQKK